MYARRGWCEVGNSCQPNWCQSCLPFLHWPQRFNAVARRIRPLSSISQSTVAHHSGFSRRNAYLARSSTDGHNGPAGDAGVASFSRASRALYAHRVAPSCWDKASVRWNCQGWRCGFAFCGRVALGHIIADYEKIHLAALPQIEGFSKSSSVSPKTYCILRNNSDFGWGTAHRGRKEIETSPIDFC